MVYRTRIASAVALAGLLAVPGAWAQKGNKRAAVAGMVNKVNTTAGSIEISGWKGEMRVVSVPASATILRLTTVPAGDLKVGDTITVIGVPRQIDARMVQSGDRIGELSAAQNTKDKADRRAANDVKRASRRADGVSVRGIVTAAGIAASNHMQLRLADGSTVQVNYTSDTKFQRSVRASLADLKVGEQARISLDPGTSTARAVLVGMERSKRAGLAGGKRAARVADGGTN